MTEKHKMSSCWEVQNLSFWSFRSPLGRPKGNQKHVFSQQPSNSHRTHIEPVPSPRGHPVTLPRGRSLLTGSLVPGGGRTRPTGIIDPVRTVPSNSVKLTSNTHRTHIEVSQFRPRIVTMQLRCRETCCKIQGILYPRCRKCSLGAIPTIQ